MKLVKNENEKLQNNVSDKETKRGFGTFNIVSSILELKLLTKRSLISVYFSSYSRLKFILINFAKGGFNEI